MTEEDFEDISEIDSDDSSTMEVVLDSSDSEISFKSAKSVQSDTSPEVQNLDTSSVQNSQSPKLDKAREKLTKVLNSDTKSVNEVSKKSVQNFNQVSSKNVNMDTYDNFTKVQKLDPKSVKSPQSVNQVSNQSVQSVNQVSNKNDDTETKRVSPRISPRNLTRVNYIGTPNVIVMSPKSVKNVQSPNPTKKYDTKKRQIQNIKQRSKVKFVPKIQENLRKFGQQVLAGWNFKCDHCDKKFKYKVTKDNHKCEPGPEEPKMPKKRGRKPNKTGKLNKIGKLNKNGKPRKERIMKKPYKDWKPRSSPLNQCKKCKAFRKKDQEYCNKCIEIMQ